MKRILTISLVLTALVFASSAQAVPMGDYVIPFWDDTQMTGNHFEGGPHGSTWYIANTDRWQQLHLPGDPLPSDKYRPYYSWPVEEEAWTIYQYQGLYPWEVEAEPKRRQSGISRFTSDKEIQTENIWWQFPRPVLIFEAPITGTYSFKGTAKWDWWADGTPYPGEISQVRFYFESWGGSSYGPQFWWFDKSTHISNWTTSMWPGGVYDQSLGTLTVDLASIAGLQNIALNAGDYLGIISGNRALLGGADPVNWDDIDAWDNSRCQLNYNPGDPVRIYGPIPQLPGDVDGDGWVSGNDLTIIITYWGQTGLGRSFGDLNDDGTVEGNDYSEVLSYWGTGTEPSEPGATPEPATLGLLALGGLAMLRRARLAVARAS